MKVALEKNKSNVSVTVNAEKPRKGAFVISVNGTPVVELLNLARPFPKLKALDMDSVVADVMKAINK